MSAATREPARTADVARHYLRLLGNEWAMLAFLLTVGLAVVASVGTRGFEGFAATLWLMLFYPLLQWSSADARGGLDEAMPLGPVRHALVRVACGAVWAGAALATSIALVALLAYAGHHGRPGAGFWWYPPLLLAFGLAFYLFGAAGCLRGETGASHDASVFVFGLMPFVLLSAGWSRLERLLSLREALAPGEAWTLVGVAMLCVAGGVAAVWLSASAPRWLPRLHAHRARTALRARGPGARPAVRRAAADAPRRAARLHRVLWREIVLLTPKLATAGVLISVIVAGPITSIGGAHDDNTTAFLTFILPIWWPVVVWPFRRRVEPVPVGPVTQQLARVAAGALWLVVIMLLLLAAPAIGVGGWTPPLDPGNAAAWVAIPGDALLLYLLASPPAILGTESRPEVRVAWYGGWLLVGLPILDLVLSHGRFSLGAALSVVARRPVPWAEAMALWIVVSTALAALAAAWGAAQDRANPAPL